MLEPFEDAHYCRPREAPAWLRKARYNAEPPEPEVRADRADKVVNYIVGFLVVYGVLAGLGLLD